MPFQGVGAMTPQDRSLVDGLADMLATNLAESKDLKVVERAQIKSAMDALKIDSSVAIDQATAAKIGGWLGATHVVVGTLAQLGDRLRLDSRVVSLQAGTVEKSARAEGTKKELFDLVNTLSTRVLANLTGETIGFSEVARTILDKPFTLSVPSTSKAKQYVSEPLFQGSSPAVLIRYVVDYEKGDVPFTSPRGKLAGLIGGVSGATGVGTSFSNPTRVQLFVNDEAVATWTPSQVNTTSIAQHPVSLDGKPANVTIETQRITAGPAPGDASKRIVSGVSLKLTIERQGP